MSANDYELVLNIFPQ